MDNPKYLIIIALIDGQNFTVPDGTPDKIETTVFAEARFGNESILRSDPVKLINSNPEFVTELAWQLDKKSLHQLRVERRSIKLQVFMQTRQLKKTTSTNNRTIYRQSSNGSRPTTNGYASNSNSLGGETHKVELVGYTILDVRSAQPKEHTKFNWYPLLNPKFRKPSYNRPEIQLALTISRAEEEENSHLDDSTNQLSSISTLPDADTSIEMLNGEHKENGIKILDSSTPSANRHNGTAGNQNSGESTKLYTTCLDISAISHLTDHQQAMHGDEIIDNDIIIRSRDGLVHIYDAKHPHKFTIDDCDERYQLTITIPFTNNLNLLVKDYNGGYNFSVSLFGVNLQTEQFREFSGMLAKQMKFDIQTTHAGVLATYFELNSNLDIKLHKSSANNGMGDCIGMATLQLNQLCSLDTTCRSIEGIFSLESPNNEIEHNFAPTFEYPSIGVSVILERYDPNRANQSPRLDRTRIDNGNNVTTSRRDSNSGDFDYTLRNGFDTHQLTLDHESTVDRPLPNNLTYSAVKPKKDARDSVIVEDHDVDGPSIDDHHYCFTIDLREFSYTPSQRLIPTLRELVIRYSYPFFGYKDTITTDASIPIKSTSSIIVSGFCEFNFATTPQPLLTALSELPLDLEILAADEARLRELEVGKRSERLVATCSINLAQLLELNQSTIDQMASKPVSRTTLVPIFALDGNEIGQLQLSLCLKDLGKPTQKFEASIDSCSLSNVAQDFPISQRSEIPTTSNGLERVDRSFAEAKDNFDHWKEESWAKLSEELRQRDDERFKRLYQRIEAKEARRDQEFKKKMDDLGNLERKFKNSLNCIEGLEKMLVDSLEHLKTKRALLEDRLDVVELKISQLDLWMGSKTPR